MKLADSCYITQMNYPDTAFEGVLEQARNLAKTQILVLGCTHFREAADNFRSQLVDTLLDKLTEFAPDVIAVENLSPELVAMMEAEGGFYGEVVERFAGKSITLARKAQSLLSLDRRAAREHAKRLAEAAVLSSSEKTRLVLLLTAAYDLNNAALLWGHLSFKERQNAAEDLGDLAAALDTYLESPSEVVSVALRLAASLKHRRVHFIDDHRDATLFELYGERINEIDESTVRHYMGQIAPLGEAERLFAAGLEQGDLWEFFLFINAPEFARALVDTEVGIYYRLNLPSSIDRMRAAQWEVRNLYMAGNLRYASALYPSGRVLALVGYAHKPFLDRYLTQLTDVQLVQLGDLS
jgi:hypothetical protein